MPPPDEIHLVMSAKNLLTGQCLLQKFCEPSQNIATIVQIQLAGSLLPPRQLHTSLTDRTDRGQGEELYVAIDHTGTAKTTPSIIMQ